MVFPVTKRQIFAFICGIVATFILASGLRLFASPPVMAQANDSLIVSAAISLKDALQEVQSLYQQTHQNVNIKDNFGASGALQQQIENGAPVDVFVSAGQKQMDILQQKGFLLTETRRNLLTNRLVLIVPKNSSLGITSFRQLTNSSVKKIAVGEPRSVPAGQYAQEVFKNLGILSQITPKLVLGSNVRQVLQFVASGNADVGVVYSSDALVSNQVEQVATAPGDLHSPIVYPVAVLKSSKNIPAAKEFTQFLLANQTKTIFEKYGFGVAQ